MMRGKMMGAGGDGRALVLEQELAVGRTLVVVERANLPSDPASGASTRPKQLLRAGLV